jgi:hypothetical protein
LPYIYVHVARGEMLTKFWLEILKGKHHSDDLGTAGRIILEWIRWEEHGRIWIGFTWLGIWTPVNTGMKLRTVQAVENLLFSGT